MMSSDERLNLVAACGIDCGICSLNMCGSDPALLERLVARGIPREKLPCAGCRNIAGHCPLISAPCETFACVREKAVGFCHECDEFPCSRLCPSSQKADVLPHNLKVFNLCTIRRAGLEDFVKASADIERRYFKGRMEIGKGPSLASCSDIRATAIAPRRSREAKVFPPRRRNEDVAPGFRRVR